MSGHTPGPWTVTVTPVAAVMVGWNWYEIMGEDDDGNPVVLAEVFSDRDEAHHVPEDQASANAALIAAAPTLLSALEVSTAFLRIEADAHRSRGDKDKAASCDGQVALNVAAIALARGEQS